MVTFWVGVVVGALFFRWLFEGSQSPLRKWLERDVFDGRSSHTLSYEFRVPGCPSYATHRVQFSIRITPRLRERFPQLAHERLRETVNQEIPRMCKQRYGLLLQNHSVTEATIVHPSYGQWVLRVLNETYFEEKGYHLERFHSIDYPQPAEFLPA